MNDDDKLKSLFNEFNPTLGSSDSDFMARLRHSMEAVEIVRRQNTLLRRHNRRSLALAALCGFAVGIVLTLLMPYLRAIGPDIAPDIALYNTFRTHILPWIMIAVATAGTALGAYRSLASARAAD